ncbi:MAG: hypothetical protein SF172_14570 [Burkholderiales bacterium]|nr:hypothetical protein [Burkholderiales bacterium]
MKRCPPRIGVLVWAALAAAIALALAGGACQAQDANRCAPRHIAW